MKKTLLLFFLLAICKATNAQPTFQKKISNEGDSLTFFGTSFCDMPDGGFVVGGLLGQVVKLDATGNLEWAVRANSSFGVFDIAAAPDGSIYYSAHVEVSPGTAYQLLIKLDTNGEKLWDKAIADSPGNFYQFLTATSDNGVVATFNGSSVVDEYHYSKFSSSGELEWARSLQSNNLDNIRAIIELDGGGFLLGGYFWNADPSGFLIKTTAGGQILWEKTLANLSSTAVAEFSNGQLLLSGNSTSAMKLFW